MPAIEGAFEEASKAAEASAECQAFKAAWQPHGEAFHQAMDAANKELSAGTIDQATYDERVKAARAAAKDYQQTEEFQTLYGAYKSIQLLGEKAYIQAISALVDEHFPLTHPAAAGESTEEAIPSGAVCQLGDPTCRS